MSGEILQAVEVSTDEVPRPSRGGHRSALYAAVREAFDQTKYGKALKLVMKYTSHEAEAVGKDGLPRAQKGIRQALSAHTKGTGEICRATFSDVEMRDGVPFQTVYLERQKAPAPKPTESTEGE